MAGLEEYRQRRNFGATPEPGGEPQTPHLGLAFVAQKHAASRLHWDFRLELDGVLLSWAVPEGPSLDPATKRLAVRVEDHPLEYASFEGVIPKGEYGGGTVMLWDRGTWEPDLGDPRKHLAKGHLKFHLDGRRLRGGWTLVRIAARRPSRDRDWLLVKESDGESRSAAELDAPAAWTTSVVTGRTMDQIADDEGARWEHGRSVVENVAASRGLYPPPASERALLGAMVPPGARQDAILERFDVELATPVSRPPDGEGWLHEVKFDGYRIVAFVDHGEVRLVSRNGNDWTERFRPLADAAAALPASQAVLDGEAVVIGPDGKTDFQALQDYARSGRAADLHYMAFDLLFLDGYDLRHVPLFDRKRLLQAVLPRHSQWLLYVDHIEGHGKDVFRSACRLELEGVVSKRAGAPHRPGRGHDWLKSKCLLGQEFVVAGYTEPAGSRSAFGALVLGLHRDGALLYVGRVGTGFGEQSQTELGARLRALEVSRATVAHPPTGAMTQGIHWVRPSLVVEVAFAGWTKDGLLRQPSFRGLRDDKSAEEVTLETPARPPSTPRPPHAPESRWPVVAGVSLSNPDRVFWPDPGVTKLELARYYEAVAGRMLPHVAGRPLALLRCPGGLDQGCFFQKHVEGFPAVVQTVLIREANDDPAVPYAFVRRLEGLVGLAQMGVLEIHPWGAKADDPDKPDRLIFDLDPDPRLPWSTVASTARLVRSELDRLGLASWVKTTGGKGLHVVAPITRGPSWDQVRDLARAFVESIVAMEPRLFTATMSKDQRGGKIYLDYVRNTRGSTAVAAYGSRARPGAPVSVPLAWEELEQGDGRPEFTVRNLADRLAGAGADPWADLPKTRQSVNKTMRARLGLSAG